MNVLVISHLYPPLSGVFVLEQVKALRELGVNCEVIAPVPWVPPMLRSLPRFRGYHGIREIGNVDGIIAYRPRVVELRLASLFCLSGYLQYLACYRQGAMLCKSVKFDLIHAHTIMPGGLSATLLGRRFHLPVVCTVHGSDINVYPQRDELTRLATRYALRQVEQVVAVSQDLKDKASRLADRVPIEVVCNGADPRRFTPMPRDRARAALGIPQDGKIVLYVGNLLPIKGVDGLLSAFKLCGLAAMLYLVGDGHLRAALAALAVKLDIGQRCVFAGEYPHDEVPLWLSAADCLVLPSHQEGMPTVLIEAMFCRTPVIASRTGGIPEILDNGKYGVLVPVRDPHALAQAIRTVLSSPDQVADTVNRAERWARDNFTWKANASRMLEIYNRVSTAASPSESVSVGRRPEQASRATGRR